MHLGFRNLVQILGMTLYCAEENQPPPAYHSLYLSIFLSFQLNFNKKYTSGKLIKSSIKWAYIFHCKNN